MGNRISEMSPRTKARLAGVCEFFEGLTSPLGQVIILGKLVVPDDAAATAANILARESLFSLGFASCVVSVFFHVAWALLFYDLFKPVHRGVSRLALFIILVGCAVQAVTCLLYMVPLLILKGGSALTAFTTPQLQSLAYLFIKLDGLAFDTYLVFFGLWCVLTGFLIFRSTFLPRIIGALLAIDGVGWMIYLFPPVGHRLFPVIAAASAVSELPLEIWLLIFGVNSERWLAQAAAAGKRAGAAT